ncbi:MAG: GNAT family N-acetyltransferase [Bacteroidota bacterium]|nr:GNAT family N-acetyltransferase [Bacteroidota bacterium]
MKIKEIRKFSTSVYDAVVRLLPQLDNDLKPPDKAYFKQVVTSGNTHFIIGEDDDRKIIGFLAIVVYIVPTGTKVWIEDVVVDEASRGKGYGTDLMLYAIDYAKSLGAKHVDLTSRPWRIAANHLYQKLGFVLRETNVYRYYLGEQS